ncbi:MAG: HEPN domain-containing protein [Lachnospiraceae bacterium]|nr:HEPN domain-containing protein [Lachnospiraceae bacterium]
MEGSLKTLLQYRLDRAEEMLKASKDNLEMNQLRTSLNRSYYAIFHAMRAVNTLDGFDSSKHSGVIAHFNQHYIKSGILSAELSKIIKSSSFLREKSDYDDFYVVSKAEAEEQLRNAELFINSIKQYLTSL